LSFPCFHQFCWDLMWNAYSLKTCVRVSDVNVGHRTSPTWYRILLLSTLTEVGICLLIVPPNESYLLVDGIRNIQTSEGKYKAQSQLNILTLFCLLQISAFVKSIIMQLETCIKEDNLNTTDYK
jgi:hypothetical protein